MVLINDQKKTAPSLSSEQINAWQSQGYLKVPDLFNEGEVTNLEDSIKRIEATTMSPNEAILHYHEAIRGAKRKSRSERFIGSLSWLDNFILNGKMIGVVEQLFGERALLFKEKINYKYPDGGGFDPHQDAAAYNFGDFHITCLIAPKPISLENGCLFLAQGEHRCGLLPTNSRRCLKTNVAEAMRWQPVLTNPRDALFFGSYTPHYSPTNKSEEARRALYLTFNPASSGNLRAEYYSQREERLAAAKHENIKLISTIQHFNGRTI